MGRVARAVGPRPFFVGADAAPRSCPHIPTDCGHARMIKKL